MMLDLFNLDFFQSHTVHVSTLKELRFFGQNCPKLKLSTFAAHNMLIKH